MFKSGGLKVVVFRSLESTISSKASKTLKNTLENYGNPISLQYKYVIPDGSSEYQLLAVKAIHAAKNQNKEQEYFRLVVESNGYTKEQLLVLAQSLKLNMPKFKEDLENNWAVAAEAIQTILRREAYPNPYEALKGLTRTNEKITQKSIADFIDTLEVSEEIKNELKQITPSNYTGI